MNQIKIGLCFVVFSVIKLVLSAVVLIRMAESQVCARYAKLRTPFTCIVAGATGSGKTHFVLRLLRYRDALLDPPPKRVIYSYERYQPAFDAMEGVEFVKGDDYKLRGGENTLLIIDDQMDVKLSNLVKLFTVDSHHLGVSVMFLTQNLFEQSKEYRTVALNAQYLFLFKSPRAARQVVTLAHQLFPSGGKSAKAFVAAYRHATQNPFSYLMVDLKPDTPQRLMVRANMLPDEGEPFTGDVRLAHCYVV